MVDSQERKKAASTVWFHPLLGQNSKERRAKKTGGQEAENQPKEALWRKCDVHSFEVVSPGRQLGK